MEDHSMDDLTMPVPDVDELLQEEVPIPRVPVDVELGTVYALPSRRTQTMTDSVGATALVQILPMTYKRARFTLISDVDIYISRTGLGTGAYWPAKVPYVGLHCDEVWVKSASGTATVGTIAELWAD